MVDEPAELGKSLLPTEQPLDSGELVDAPEAIALPSRGKPSQKQPLGRQVFDRKAFAQYQAQPLESKREYLKQQWLDVAYLCLGKGASLALTLGKKDYGRLVQILTSAGIAYDKVFPKGDTLSVNLAVNMFKGLPQEKVLRVLGPTAIPCGGKPLEETIP